MPSTAFFRQGGNFTDGQDAGQPACQISCNPDDIIRIYHFLDTAKDIPELQFVKVLSVTDSKGYNVDNTKELSEEEEKQQSATITVLASPEQAKIITGLENDGMAHVALISRGNEALAEELLAEQDQLLTELYYPELA